jgi:hypothetical protein
MATPDNAPERKALQSWKEIATFLGVTVRSVQRWESGGLPVYRQGDGRKARVFAYPDELTQWLDAGGLRERETASEAVAEPPESNATAAPVKGPPPSRRIRRKLWWVAAGVAAGLAVAVLWRAVVFPTAPVPAHWTLDGSKLRVLDAAERLCWDKTLPPFDAAFDVAVRDKVVIADIDGDGRMEVLLSYLPAGHHERPGRLMCFDHRGRLRWESRFGAARTFGARQFDANYVGAFVKPVTAAGRRLLLTVANHHIWYPSQAALLDPATGKVVEEYWHPGAIYNCLLHDIDGDGQPEAVLGGTNNPGDGLGHAGVAILKLPFSKAPRRAPAPDDPFPPVTGGGELAYALFPLPDFCRLRGILGAVITMSVDQYRRILVETPGAIVYYLGPHLNVMEYRFSGEFEPLHDREFHQGVLDHRLDAAEKASMGKVATFAWAPDGNSPQLKRFWKY